MVLFNGEEVEDLSQIPVANRLFGNLTLQCIGHSATSVQDLVWTSEEAGGGPVVLQGDAQSSEYISASYDYNLANMTINNLLGPYRGTVKCRTATLDRTITVFITESNSIEQPKLVSYIELRIITVFITESNSIEQPKLVRYMLNYHHCPYH